MTKKYVQIRKAANQAALFFLENISSKWLNLPFKCPLTIKGNYFFVFLKNHCKNCPFAGVGI